MFFRNVVLSAALFNKAGAQNRKRRNSDEDKTSHTSLESLSTVEKLPSVSNSKLNIIKVNFILIIMYFTYIFIYFNRYFYYTGSYFYF
jgi:hypothetical protein